MVERVLIVSPVFRPNIGGVETHLDDLCEYLRKRGHMVYVITYQPITTEARGPSLEKKENLEIHRIPWPGHNLFHKLEPYPPLEFLYLFPGLFLYGLYFLLRRRRDIDVIHAHGLVSAFVGLLLAKAFRKRAVFSSHAIYNLGGRPLLARAIKTILSCYDRVLCLSEPSRRELIRIGMKEENVGLYTYWVDQTLFRPMERGECRKDLALREGFVALFVGRLLEIKGVNLLLEAWKDFDDTTTLLIVGDGPLEERIREAARERSNVLFHGKIKNSDLPKYYCAADVTLVPSLYEEGFGRVILESLSCGTPVIASHKGGIPEALDASVGILVEPTLANLKDALIRLKEDPTKIEAMRSNCRGFAEVRFGERNAELITKSYKKNQGAST